MSDLNRPAAGEPAGGPAGLAGPSAAVPPSGPPPHGPRLRVILLVLAVAVVALLAGAKWGGGLTHYYEQVAGGHAEHADHGDKGKIQYYTCGMHPSVVLPGPGLCPICHMALVPLDPDKASAQITISPIISQDIGVRTAPVVAGPLSRIIRTVGIVDYDETTVRDVTLKISGWVEKLYVDYTGKPVTKGQKLLDIYSPELYSAQEEYLQAYRRAGSGGSAATQRAADMPMWNNQLLDSARKRLEYFDISDEQIRQLEKSGKVAKTLTLTSPYDGVVVQKSVYQGAKVDAGAQLYRIADLSKVWVMVTLYEYQLPYIHEGQDVTLSLPYAPGQTFAGKLTYIYPYLNQTVRQVKARLEVDNAKMTLKPGMFADVELRGALGGERILVPREAVIDTGERQVAFVSLGGGRFEPRNVRTGAEGQDGQIEILDGLKVGEVVVTSGQFLLDSESRLREAMAKMIKGNVVGEATSEPMTMSMPSGQEHHAAAKSALAPQAQKQVDRMVTSYLAIEKLLAADKTEGLAERLAAVADAAKGLASQESLKSLADRVAQAAGTKAATLAEFRTVNKTLSTAVIELVKAAPPSTAVSQALYQVHCPMVNADWLQTDQKVSNPYDTSMSDCGSVVGTIQCVAAAGEGPA